MCIVHPRHGRQRLIVRVAWILKKNLIIRACMRYFCLTEQKIYLQNRAVLHNKMVYLLLHLGRSVRRSNVIIAQAYASHNADRERAYVTT